MSPGKSVGSRGEYRWEGDLESVMEGFLEEAAFQLSAETSSGEGSHSPGQGTEFAAV